MVCIFCDRKHLESQGIIAETKNFLLVPSFGQIVEGYSLIIPKRHVRCYARLPLQLIEEYLEFKGHVDRAVTEAYKKPIYFEHGVIGQNVRHAHMHCVPTEKDLLSRLERVFTRHRISSEADLQAILKEYEHYFYYERTEKYAFTLPFLEAPLRHALADEIGLPEAGDWRNMNSQSDKNSMQRTVKNLSSFFK